MGASYTDTRLAKLTENFTLNDWAKIRTPAHWAKRDAMKWQDEKNRFLLIEVEKYLRTK